MRLFEFGQYIYHVTHTNRIPKIKKKGLLPMQPSNWVKAKDGERYGSGEIYAFTSKYDATRWAARMDWDAYGGTGTGKVSIITLRPEGNWEIDDADPISQAGNRGEWIKSMRAIGTENIVEIEPLTPEMVRSINSMK